MSAQQHTAEHESCEAMHGGDCVETHAFDSGERHLMYVCMFAAAHRCFGSAFQAEQAQHRSLWHARTTGQSLCNRHSQQESEVLGTSRVLVGEPVAVPWSEGVYMLMGSVSEDKMPEPQAVHVVATPLYCTQLA
jgi:hypothetical protein